MNLRFVDLVIAFKKENEQIEFKDFNYFYGQMGAGKSTIARLVDYCLGGELGKDEMTPALQSEFVSASLSLEVENHSLVLERNANSAQVRAQWSNADQQFEILVPARKPAGEVLSDTGIEVLSDLIYHLAGKKPPKVRKSKIMDDSELERLSFRDLLWYCYLDQDSIDSSFYHLDSGANIWKQLKSRDVLRFIIGFHQEHVSELEVQLESVRAERMKCQAGATAISEALSSAEIASDIEIAAIKRGLESEIRKTDAAINDFRTSTQSLRTPAMETLKEKAKLYARQIHEIECALEDIKDSIEKDKAHKNELLALSARFKRSQSAREVLSGVNFINCPSCGNQLSPQPPEICSVCGQLHSETTTGSLDADAAEQDVKSRVDELAELVSLQENKFLKFGRRLREIIDEKNLVDVELNHISETYDSAYLSAALETEKKRSSLQQQLLDLKKLEALIRRIAELSERADNLVANEQKIRSQLKDARKLAEKDAKNLNRLKALFLDCLLRAKIPGFQQDDIVEMKSPHFLPEVHSADSGDLTVTSFTNLGSGGKKTLFKCCFAVAMHRLSAEVGAMLPKLLIIDSPMKNISERENRTQFEGFHKMLYDLCDSELKGTQFILIDKEYCPPPDAFQSNIYERYMTLDDPNYPPLIRYYRGSHMVKDKTPEHIKLDERNHVELPLLEQLKELGWEILDLDNKQNPGDSNRQSFTEVVMYSVLREQLKVINPWLEDDQVEEVVKRLTASFPSTGLIQNNRHVFRMLLENTIVNENRQTDEKSPTVRFVDFTHRDNNRFIAVCQFKVRILGTEHHIVPDIVLFLNGLPVVVIECKSPKVKDAIPEAIDQILRYSEQRGAKGEGSASLFFYNQIVIATCRNGAKFGTITTHIEKHFYRWADPYPRTVDELDHGNSSPNDQQRLVAGMLDRDNLLDLIRTFTLFSTNDKGETIKIVGRYQQFRAVKLAVQRLQTGQNPRKRSGIIWHTQGSGKSLTMMFMVREMYRHAQLSNWKVVFVTDRTQLEQQLSETSQSIGFTVKVAEFINPKSEPNGKSLKELLRSDTSDLVMAMIHKFREADLTETFPELNASPNILVMTDEAHRSQYALLGANFDKGLPNAARIGYTGTPIDKTERVFGDYIDKYTMRQAIDDGVTLEIVYEGRTHNAEVADQAGMDKAFVDVFSDYNLQQRLDIIGYGTRDAYLEAEPTIEAKAKDMVDHYLTHVFPNGYKAQVVATSREAAVRYKKHIDNALAAAIIDLEQSNPKRINLDILKNLTTDVIISGNHNDLPHLKEFSDKSKHERSIKSFKLSFESENEDIKGNMGFLIVNNMLITGFDAPVEQVMYLDKVIVAHSLLQAIARVNRVSDETKEKGFVVDYVGIGHHLKKAIDNYDEREQKELIDTLCFPEEELRELAASYADIMELLKSHNLTDLTDHDAFFDVFYDEELRFDFMLAFKKLTKCLNIVFPARQALDYMADYQALTEINLLAGKHFRDERLSMKGIPPKLRAITDVYLESKGIEIKIEPISILDEDFQNQVGKRNRTKTKASEIEHAIRHHLEVEMDDDPDLQASFAQALTAILEAFRDNWKKIYEELEKLRERIINARKEPTYGLHRKKQMPLFRVFKRELFGDKDINEDEISLLVDLTQQIYLATERELKLTGFWESIPARNKLKAELQSILLAEEFKNLPGIVSKRAHIISRIMEIAEKNNDIILYAE